MKIIPIEKYKLLSSRNASISKKDQTQSRLFYFRKNRYLQVILPVFLLYWLIMPLETYNRVNWFMENIFLFCSMIFLVYTYKWFRFSNKSYLMITIIFSLHIIGAKYSYALVPYDNILPLSILPERNIYDRFVGLFFGFAFMLPSMEISRLCLKIKGNRSVISSVLIIISAVSIYKVLEMWAYDLVSPEFGNIFLASQGDIMDSVKDIEMCIFGSLSFIVYITLRYKFNEYKIKKIG